MPSRWDAVLVFGTSGLPPPSQKTPAKASAIPGTLSPAPFKPSYILPTLLMTSFNDFAFVHKTCAPDPLHPERFTKFELAGLISIQGYPLVCANCELKPPVPMSETESCQRKSNALHLKAQNDKKSDDKVTECRKEFFKYSNAYYFRRCYKFMDKDYFKLEITKVPLGQRGWMSPEATLHGLTKAMKWHIRGAENFLLPHYMHQDDYTTINDFLGIYDDKPTE